MPRSIDPHNRAQIQARERRVWDSYIVAKTHDEIAAEEHAGGGARFAIYLPQAADQPVPSE